MQEIIKKLQDKISSESTPPIPPEAVYYIAGLADALEIVKQRIDDKLKVGQEYYVLMPEGLTYGRPSPKNDFRPLKMLLYQIKVFKNNREMYCFKISDDRPDWYMGTPKIQFSNPTTLELRVFKSESEAEKHKETKLWTFRKPYI